MIGCRVLAAGALFLASLSSASAQTLSVAHSFGASGTDGIQPFAGLALGNKGSLVGTTSDGGVNDLGGTVFQIAADGTYSIVHNFNDGSNTFPEGQDPQCDLVRDGKGNIWGTTFNGGALGDGVIFKITSKGVYSVVHDFGADDFDGYVPRSGLLRDASANLWGTTFFGGEHGAGAVYKIAADGTYSIAHSFTGTDGRNPIASLIRGKLGSLWGTTSSGGANGKGTVFEIASDGTYSVAHSFTVTDGATPIADLFRDKKGNLWGTTARGGANAQGVVFKITPKGVFSVVHDFGSDSADGTNPQAGLVQDALGNLWGTTDQGGANGLGTLFEITTDGTYAVWHSFDGTDGANPQADLFRDKLGNLWGTTHDGGANGLGTVFKIVFSPPA